MKPIKPVFYIFAILLMLSSAPSFGAEEERNVAEISKEEWNEAYQDAYKSGERLLLRLILYPSLAGAIALGAPEAYSFRHLLASDPDAMDYIIKQVLGMAFAGGTFAAWYAVFPAWFMAQLHLRNNHNARISKLVRQKLGLETNPKCAATVAKLQ